MLPIILEYNFETRMLAISGNNKDNFVGQSVSRVILLKYGQHNKLQQL